MSALTDRQRPAALIETIPAAQEVRSRLAELVREQATLRALLRAAERAEKTKAQGNQRGAADATATID
jgi:replicative DNA helicase